MIVNLDSAVGRRGASRRRRPRASRTIDYDRLTLGGGADYYVSFDNVAVGTAIGEGLVKCMQDNGDEPARWRCSTARRPTTTPRCSSRATRRRSRTPATRSPPTRPCRTGTTRRPARSSSRCSRRPTATSSGVAAANDGLGGAVAAVLERNGDARQDPDHRSGRHGRGPAARAARHAVHDGLQGDQEGGRRGRRSSRSRWPRATRPAPTRWRPARSRTRRPASRSSRSCCSRRRIFPDNVKDVVADGFVTPAPARARSRSAPTRRIRLQKARHGTRRIGDP